MKSPLRLLLVLFALFSPLAARILHVASDGDDSRDGLSPETAWRTPQAAADRAEPGDTILFRGEFATSGPDLITVRRSGREGAPITLRSAPGSMAILRNQGAWQAILVEGASHIVIEDLRIIGDAGSITLEEARKEMNNLGNPRTCGNGIGIVAHPQTKVPSSHVVVRRCVISDMPGGGLYMRHSDRVIFEDNIVFNNSYWAPYANSGISIYQPADADDDTTSYKIIIRRNVSYGNLNRIPFYFSNPDHPERRTFTDGNGIILDDYYSSQAFGGGKGKGYAGRTLVANNVVFDNGGSGIHAYLSNHVDVVHNLAFNNNLNPGQSADGQIFFNSSADSRALNNILVAPAGKPVNTDWNNKVGVVYDHNLYADMEGGRPVFHRALAANRVASAGLIFEDWRLDGKRIVRFEPDSAALDLGTVFPAVETDFFGRPFPADGPRPAGPFAGSR